MLWTDLSCTLRKEVVMSKSCKGLAMELVKCLSESDCVKVFEYDPSLTSLCIPDLGIFIPLL